MAVVALIGLLAAATAWTLTDSAQQATYSDVIDRLSHADQSARFAGQRLGPSTLCYDLDRQRVWIEMPGERQGREQAGHSMQLPTGYRIEQVVWIDPTTRTGSQRDRPRQRVRAEQGVARLPISSAGLSRTYAIRLVGPSRTPATNNAQRNDEQTTWLLVSGLTGQVTIEDDEQTIDKLLSALAQPRPDAD